MKRIGLSQRVDQIGSYNERRDSIDQAWYKFLLASNYLPIPLPNIDKEHIEHLVSELDLDGLILTGGNSLSFLDWDAKDIAPERDECEAALIKFMLSKKLPVIGVCRGMQVINDYFGGLLSKVNDHIAVKHEITNLSKSIALPNSVNSYHSWGIMQDNLAPPLSPIAKDSQGNIEAFVNDEETLLGIMWHPERESPFNEMDIKLLKRILK